MAEPRWLTDDEQRVWRAFLAAVLPLFDHLDRELMRAVGLPRAHYQILAMLSEAPARTLRMGELASQTRQSRSRLSHAVDRLEDKGFVRRVSCPGDKRGAFAELTGTGFAVLESAAPSHVETVRQVLFERLTAAQVRCLGAISATVAAHLAAADAAAQSADR